MRVSPALVLGLALVGCLRPMPLTERTVLRQVASHYHAFYAADADPDPAHDAGVLRPRFGAPALARASEAFPLELIERGGPTDVHAVLVARTASTPVDCSVATGDGAYPLSLRTVSREPIGAGAVHVTLAAQPPASIPLQGYDLVVCARGDEQVRIPRAVWYLGASPETLHVAQLSDVHVRGPDGRGDRAAHELAHLREVIADVNRLAPDVVVVTGDVLNQGYDARLGPIAREALLRIEAPLLIIPGNHDHGLGAEAVLMPRPYRGWSHFAQSFHPELFYRVTVGAWDFVGFDSGASELSPWVATRGVSPETVARISGAVDDAYAAGRNVVLFTHAPTRARLLTRGSPENPGWFGRMRHGGPEIERVMLHAAERGQRLVMLSGHTHWSALFDAQSHGHGMRFELQPEAGAHTCAVHVGPAAIVTSQSATHTSFSTLPNGHGYGFAWIELSAADTRVAFHRYGVPAEECAEE